MLKRFFVIFLSCFMLSNCGLNPDGTITVQINLETDTFISSDSDANHSEYTYLSVSRSPVSENRILVKLPTGERNEDTNLDYCLTNPYCFVYFMPLAILRAILAPSCADESYTAANLNWAYLQLDTVDGSSPAAGTLRPQLLAQPWWHDVNWRQAHPFTKAGLWTTAGGSINSGVTFEPNCTNLQGGQTCAAGEVKFEVTDYFKSLLNNLNSTHYGLLISAITDTSEIRFHSVQALSGNVPKIVANYNCVIIGSSVTAEFYLDQQL